MDRPRRRRRRLSGERRWRQKTSSKFHERSFDYRNTRHQCKLKPRHVLLLLSLASRKFKKKKIRVYWEELAEDLGVNKDTVRKWAYELRDWGLLWIAQHRGRDPDRNRVGHRNERNSFDPSSFVEVVDKAYRIRRKDRERSRGGN